jgi:hypothetical protein
VAHTGEVFILVSRARIDIDTDAGEVAWQSLCCDSYAIGEGGDLVEFNGVLGRISMTKEAVDTGVDGPFLQIPRMRTAGSSSEQSSIIGIPPVWSQAVTSYKLLMFVRPVVILRKSMSPLTWHNLKRKGATKGGSSLIDADFSLAPLLIPTPRHSALYLKSVSTIKSGQVNLFISST